jgi:hypothetical protein
VLSAYVGIAIVNNLRPPRKAHEVIRQKVLLNWVERGDHAKQTFVVAYALWTIAKAQPDAVVACVDVVVPKEDLIDMWGNAASRDISLLRAVVWDLKQVRQYPNPGAYLDDDRSAARWQERPCI